MDPRTAFPLAAIAPALIASLLWAALASAADPSAPCRMTPCRAEMRVGPEEVRWSSIEAFYPANERLKVVLIAPGRRLRLLERWGPQQCRAAYRGSGIIALVKACGSQTPLRLRAYRLKRKRLKLVVAYRATPVLSG